MEVPNIPAEINPLSDEHLNLINEILQSAKNTELLIRGCQYCGLDVGNCPEQNEAQAEICRKLKQVFFPTRM